MVNNEHNKYLIHFFLIWITGYFILGFTFSNKKTLQTTNFAVFVNNLDTVGKTVTMETL